MQGKDFVFKVPKMRKRWQSLYCTESLSDLDEIWDASKSNDGNTRLKSIQHTLAENNGISQPYDREVHDFAQHGTSGSNDISEATKISAHIDKIFECELYPHEEFLVKMDEDGDSWFKVPENKYTMGLLKELSTFSQDTYPVREASGFGYQNETDICMRSIIPSWKEPWSNSDQSLGGEKETFFKQESACASKFVQDFDSPRSPDVLIVRDDSMANADSSESDEDWESLTPPASRSPRDHTVPDLDDLSTITPGNFLLYPHDPFSSSFQMDDLNATEQEYTQNDISMHRPLSYPNADQICPDFYC